MDGAKRMRTYELRVVVEYRDGRRDGWWVMASEPGVGCTYWVDSNGAEGVLKLSNNDLLKAVAHWVDELTNEQLSLW